MFGRLPRSFDAFTWHYYTYDVPPAADELARSARCNQAFRLGDTAWGIQFHAEVTLDTVNLWLQDEEDFPHVPDPTGLAAETAERIGAWNDLGRNLAGAFLEVAARTAVAV